MDSFRSDLPRLASLHDEFVSKDAGNFFYRFPQRLVSTDSVTFRYYQRIEHWLSFVPDKEWPTLRKKVKTTTFAHLERRFWQQLHDVFSEALGFKLLVTKYHCSEVGFYRPSDTRTPDLWGVSNGSPSYMEVKTLNHTEEERLSWYELSKLNHTVHLPPGVQRRLLESYQDAVSQLRASGESDRASKIVLLAFHIDYNIEPLDQSLERLVTEYLNSIEQEGFPIDCHVIKS